MTTLILSVGNDPTALNLRTKALEARGHLVKSAYSVREAFREFAMGDFDAVVLCPSIDPSNRRLLSRRIRESGSRVPIIVADDRTDLSTMICATSHEFHPVHPSTDRHRSVNRSAVLAHATRPSSSTGSAMPGGAA